jgi:hypothetical protein
VTDRIAGLKFLLVPIYQRLNLSGIEERRDLANEAAATVSLASPSLLQRETPEVCRPIANVPDERESAHENSAVTRLQLQRSCSRSNFIQTITERQRFRWLPRDTVERGQRMDTDAIRDDVRTNHLQIPEHSLAATPPVTCLQFKRKTKSKKGGASSH